MKYILILVICLLLPMVSQGEVVTIGHFQSLSNPDFMLLISKSTVVDWRQYAQYYPIVNIRGSIIDGICYAPYEYSIPEPATVTLILGGLVAIRRIK